MKCGEKVTCGCSSGLCGLSGNVLFDSQDINTFVVCDGCCEIDCEIKFPSLQLFPSNC
jgi:hypothetical protein